MNVVTRLLPFHFTTEAGTKFEPLTVKVKAAPCAVFLFGERLVSVGTGFRRRPRCRCNRWFWRESGCPEAWARRSPQPKLLKPMAAISNNMIVNTLLSLRGIALLP